MHHRIADVISVDICRKMFISPMKFNLGVKKTNSLKVFIYQKKKWEQTWSGKILCGLHMNFSLKKYVAFLQLLHTEGQQGSFRCT